MKGYSPPRFRFIPRERPDIEERPRATREQLLTIILFIIPGAVIYTLFLIMPLLEAGRASLYDWNGLGPLTNFVGLANYERALQHNIFHTSIGNTLLIMVLSLLLQLPLALGLALMVGRTLPGRAIFRSIFFLPYVFSEVITGLIWLFVYHPRGGLANTVFTTLIPGFEPLGWLANRDIAMLCIFVVITWKYFGLHMILYMAAIQTINDEVEEAARIDGASELQMLTKITIPLIAPTIRTTIYLSVIGSLNQFVLIWVMTTGGPANATQVMASYMYRFGIKSFHLGYGSAVALIIFGIALVFSVGYQRTILRQDYMGKA